MADLTTREATQNLIDSIKRGASLLHIADNCVNLYGFWLTEGISKDKLEPIVQFLVRMNELNQLTFQAKGDDILLDIERQKKDLEKKCSLVVWDAIAQLVQLLQPIVEKEEGDRTQPPRNSVAKSKSNFVQKR